MPVLMTADILASEFPLLAALALPEVAMQARVKILEGPFLKRSVLWQAPDAQRLFREAELLDDSKTLAELKVETDSVLAVTYQIPGQNDITFQFEGSKTERK